MKKGLYRTLAGVLFCCVVISLSAVSVAALSWNGSSTGGGGGGVPATANGYAVYTTNDNCIGYRFSVVDKGGSTKNGKVIDVFRNTTRGNSAYTSHYKFSTKYNKKQLITNQNNNYSTAKTTANCFKETNMGFASALGQPNSMGTWQNNKNNLNSVLSNLELGNINNLKNGDKLLVEPLFDIKLKGTYHSLTTTEIAIYGKWLLGVNSNGGSSKNSESWGFIAKYTNQHYPNSLYTTNAQGLWTNASSLSAQATFYNIINKGYGVGIAYTETKPDFTPALRVNICEAWAGTKGTRTKHYGNSNGSAFDNFTYANGYPISGDKVWFCLNFPAETENCYVRQTVWIDGGGSTSRNVYSNSNTWYEVALSPQTVATNKSSYVVKARVDWIDSNGNVKKYGTEKSFYIPIRPKINRQQVAMTDITGKTAAYAGSNGNGGSVYVGQQVYPKYTYTSSNSWTSYNHIRGALYEWKNNGWITAYSSNSGSDVYADNQRINSKTPFTRYSGLGLYRIPNNSTNTNGANRVPVKLWTQWTSDVNRTTETTWIDIPIIKADPALQEIKLIDNNGNYITTDYVYAGQEITPQYVYKNNTNCTVFVEGYNHDKSRISGTYEIPPNGTIYVNGTPKTVSSTGTFSIWGGVYLDGAGRGNTVWESNGNNNERTKSWSIRHPLIIEALAPNSNYREDVEVMTTFKVKNAASCNYTPNQNISVKFGVYHGSALLYSTIKSSVVIPANGENIAYFKWKVPKGLNDANLTIKGEVLDNGNSVDITQLHVQTEVPSKSTTPDTKYETSKPAGWTMPAVQTPVPPNAAWSEWIYTNGNFQKKSYNMYIQYTSPIPIIPDSNSPSASYENGTWKIKSGYGFTVNYMPVVRFNSVLTASSTAYTLPQSGYMTFPEFSYSTATGKYKTLELMSGNFQFPQNPNAGNKRLHFIPVWFPNGTKNYTPFCYFYDCWTPAGMISACINANSFSIIGSQYDDWYNGR